MDQFLLKSEHSGPGSSKKINYGPDKDQNNLTIWDQNKKSRTKTDRVAPYGPWVRSKMVISGSLPVVIPMRFFFDHFYFPHFSPRGYFLLVRKHIEEPYLGKLKPNVTRLLINEARSFKVYFRTHVLLFFSLKRHNLLEF